MMLERSGIHVGDVESWNIWSIGKDTLGKKTLGSLLRILLMLLRKLNDSTSKTPNSPHPPIVFVPLKSTLPYLTLDSIMKLRIPWAKALHYPSLELVLILFCLCHLS